MNPTFDYDIVIAGGGMVGASMALLLSHHSQHRLRILVIERFASAEKNHSDKINVKPSFDARSSALSYGSRLILESLGLWPELEQKLCPINSIHVCEGGCIGSTLMTSEETQWPALGYVIENAWLGNVLLSALNKKSNIKLLSPASVSAVHNQYQRVVADIDQDNSRTSVSTQLVVVADGANSKLREQLGVAAKARSYERTALIANVGFTKPHNGRAYERFTSEGPTALLPLTDSEQGMARSALVWTMSADSAQTLSQCDANTFLYQLQKHFGHRQGEFIRVGERASYPLILIEAQEQVRSGIVIMGNAAHSLHPVAGQGFNLALRDCARLAMITAKNITNGILLGQLSSLHEYLNQRQCDQQKTIGFSDLLPALFSHRQWGVGIARRLGLTALDVMPEAKKYFISHAAGMHDGASMN